MRVHVKERILSIRIMNHLERDEELANRMGIRADLVNRI